MNRQPEEPHEDRARGRLSVDAWCLEQLEFMLNFDPNDAQTQDLFNYFDGFLEEEQRHGNQESFRFDILRMNSPEQSNEAEENSQSDQSIHIVGDEGSDQTISEPPSPQNIIDAGVMDVDDEAELLDGAVRRGELHGCMRSLMEREHRLTTVYLTRENIIGKHEIIKALRTKEANTVGLVAESAFEETSSVGTSIDQYSLEDDFDQNNNTSFGYWDFDDHFICSNEFPEVTYHHGNSMVHFEAMFGAVEVKGYIVGDNHPKYMNLVACRDALRHNNIQRPFYDLPLLTTSAFSRGFRHLLQERLADKRIVFQEKVGVSLNKALSKAQLYGVPRFLRDFYHQLFEIVSYVHQKEFREYVTTARLRFNLSLIYFLL